MERSVKTIIKLVIYKIEERKNNDFFKKTRMKWSRKKRTCKNATK
jgi:hypothetical protein